MPYVSGTAAAAELGITQATLRRWAEQGKIDTVRTTGGHRRYDVAGYLAKRDERDSDATGNLLHSLADLLGTDLMQQLESKAAELDLEPADYVRTLIIAGVKSDKAGGVRIAATTARWRSPAQQSQPNLPNWSLP